MLRENRDKKNAWNKLWKRFLSMFLVACISVTGNSMQVLAGNIAVSPTEGENQVYSTEEGSQGQDKQTQIEEQKIEEQQKDVTDPVEEDVKEDASGVVSYDITLNGQNLLAASFESAVQIQYADAMSFSLAGYDNSVPSVIFYLDGNTVITDETRWTEFNGDSLALLPGSYYIGYDFTDSGSGDSYTSLKGTYKLKVVRAVLSAPQNISWENGSTAKWDAVDKNTSGGALSGGAAVSYEVSLYKDNGLAATLTTSDTTYDFKNEIETRGPGIYTFQVKARVQDEMKDRYDDSEQSVMSENCNAVKLTVKGDNGIASITPDTDTILISSSEDKSANVTATLKAGREFSGWTSTEPSIQIDDAGSLNTTVSIPNSYSGASEVILTANTIDKNPPQITGFSAGTGENEGKFVGQAKDTETGINSYAFSTADTQEGVLAEEWIAGNQTPESTDTYIFAPTQPGQYYFYVKDAGGNITRSSEAIKTVKIRYQGYYKNNVLTEYTEFAVGTVGHTLIRPEKYGYVFKGWFLDSSYATAEVSTIQANNEAADNITVYAKWEKEAIQYKTQPEDHIDTYDGMGHVLSAEIDDKYRPAVTEYQWYKDNVAISGAMANTLTVKNVADSGTYYVIAKLNINGETAYAKSSDAHVSITKATLSVVANDNSISYGDPAPVYTISYSGFMPGENESNVTFDGGTVSCTYDPTNAENGKVGTYTILLKDYRTDNYAVTMKNGTLLVTRKNAGQPESQMQAVLDNTNCIYDPDGARPGVSVTDHGSIVDESNYTVEYRNNTAVGDAQAIITFHNNYTGTITLPFKIVKADFTTNVEIDGWIYGNEADDPYIVSNESGGTVTYYYYSENKEDAVPTVPTDAGTYHVYAVIAATDDYNEVTTEPATFTIAKRKIIFKASTASWPFDGNNHFSSDYTVDGTFAGSDSCNSVVVTGNITNVGSTENVISYTLSSSTKESNYDIETVNGMLYVTAKSLNMPLNLKWSQEAPGLASWIAVTKTDVDVQYDVMLFAVRDGREVQVGSTVRSMDTSYDFSSMILEDARVNGENGKVQEAGYFFKVSAVSAGGPSQADYENSPYSAASKKIYTAKIQVASKEGIDSVTIDGDTKKILIQGQSAEVAATVKSGYTFDFTIWRADQAAASFTDENSETTRLKLSDTMTAPLNITIYASSTDDAPVIGRFEAVPMDNNKQVEFTLAADDTTKITGWAITNSSKAPDKNSTVWQPVDEQTILVTKTVDKAGVYYAWAKDNGNNIVRADNSVSVYQIDFDGNENDASSSMNSLLKVQDITLQLPLNRFKKEGFVFLNWKGTENGSIYANGGNYVANASDTLTAQWTNQQFNYEVNYYYMDEFGNYSDVAGATKTFAGGYNATIASSNSSIQNSKPGMARDNTKDSNIKLTDDGQKLNIYYKRREYTITYSYTTPQGEYYEDKESYLYEAPTGELLIPVVPGYSFVGWIYGESGSAPITMPCKNVTATGYFVAKNATYNIHYYTQNVDGSAYTLVSDMDETKEAQHDDEITANISDAKEMQGFEAKGVSISKGAAGGSNPTELKESVTGKVSVKEDQTLNINYYYTRKSYTLTLNVWKANRSSDENRMYTKAWTVMYGEAITPDYYANYEADKWEEHTDINGYQLAGYSDWSTGDTPTVMPAGDVTVNRDYVSTTISSYQVQLYFETDQEDVFEQAASLTYYENIGEHIAIGSGSLTVDSIQNSISSGKYYDYDNGNPNELLEGTVTDVNDNAVEPLVLRVYFKRKTAQTTIRFYYMDSDTEGSGGDGTNGRPIEIGTLTKSGIWGHSYDCEALAFFRGSGVPASFSTYNSAHATVEGTAAENYNFLQNGYTASYYGYYKMNGEKVYPSYRFNTVDSLNHANITYFGQENNYINVYYSKSSVEKEHYYLDLTFTPSELKYASAEDKGTYFPLAEKIDGVTYKIRVANKSDIFNSVYVPKTDDRYPGLSNVIGTYTYTGGLKEGYREVPFTNSKGVTSTYYTKDDPEGNYLYIIDEKNQFFYGNSISYDYFESNVNTKNNEANVGYSCVETYLNNYKDTYGDVDHAPYDDKLAGIYTYNGRYSGVMYSNGRYVFKYMYGNTYSLTYNLSGNSYRVNFADKQHVVVSDGTSHFTGKDGYDICWYKDASYENKAEDFNIHQDTSLYGRYEKSELQYHEYYYYEDDDSLTVNGNQINYLTKKELDAAKSEWGYTDAATSKEEAITLSKTQLSSYQESGSEDFTNEFSVTKEVPVTTTWYYYEGILILKDVLKYGTTYSEISMNYMDAKNLSGGVHYDDANSNNTVRGYAQLTPTDLCVYYARDEYNLTLYKQLTSLNTAEVSNYKYQKKIQLDALTRDGYTFAGWSFKKWDANALNESGELGAWVELSASETPVQQEDGSVNFRMPAYHLQATANWTPKNFEKTITHYFQQTTQTYNTELLTKLRASTYSKDIDIYQENVKRAGKLYYEDAERTVFLGASVVNGDYTYYYSDAAMETGRLVVRTVDLIAATSVITRTSLQNLKVSDFIFSSSQYNMFGFSFAVSQDGKGIATLYQDDSFVYEYDRTMDYFYTRTAAYNVRETVRGADGETAHATLMGGGSHQYGETVELKASLPLGYSFVGWYNAKDILDSYTSTDPLDSVPLIDGWETRTPLSKSIVYETKIMENVDYVAVVSPDPVDNAEVVITGNQNYEYEYAKSTSNTLTAVVNFEAEASSANYVSGYQWYEDGHLLEGENAATYLFPVGKDKGVYNYSCKVTISRKDNGRSKQVQSETYPVTVAPTQMTIYTQDYSGIYDGEKHKIKIWVNDPADPDDYQIYYSTEQELDSSNYDTNGVMTCPSFKDVAEDEDGKVTPYQVYYYIKNITGNFEDRAGSGTVYIEPATVTLSATSNAFSKIYDGNANVNGDVTLEGTEKYKLSHGNYYKIYGLAEKDKDKGYILDFNAEFNDKHVDTTSTVTLTDLLVVDDHGNRNVNYCFPQEYALVVPGYISPYHLQVHWDAVRSFEYDGTSHAPAIAPIEAAVPDTDLSVTVQGEQTNKGNYTAYASVENKGTYVTSDYYIDGNECNYTIEQRAITITPLDVTEIYDGNIHTLSNYSISGSGLLDGSTYEITHGTGKKDIGEYEIKGNSMHIYQGDSEVTDNYAITYATGRLNITKRPVKVSGIKANDKVYDRNTNAQINLSGVIFDGKIDSDDLALDQTKITGKFQDANAGNNKKVALTYDQSTLSGTDASNYSINIEESQKDTTAAIKSDVITVTAKNIDTVYGEDAAFQVSYTGFKDGDDASCIEGDVTYTITPLGSSDVAAKTYSRSTGSGKYVIHIDLSGLTSNNYSFRDGTVNAILNVEKRPIMIKAKNSTTKTYDGTTAGKAWITRGQYEFVSDPSETISGITNEDTVALSNFMAIYNSENVLQAEKITVSGMTLNSSNYRLTNGTLEVPASITKKELRISADPKAAVYGETAPTFTATYHGLVTGESGADLSGELAFTCGYDTSEPTKRGAGSYPITLTGKTSSNYDITYVNSQLTVQKKEVKVTADSKIMTYGLTVTMPVYTYKYSGFVYGESESDVTGSVSLSCKDHNGNEADLSTMAGNYNIVPALTLNSSNYTFTPINGTLTILKKDITVSGIKVKTKVYDGTKNVATTDIDLTDISYSGILASDVEKQGVSVKAVYTDKNAGIGKTVQLQVELNSYLKENYLLNSTTQSTTTADISPKVLNIKAVNKTILYGADVPAYAVTYEGFVTGEDKTALDGTLTFDENYHKYDNVGTYLITPKGYTSTNYEIHYASADLSVNSAKLTSPVVSWYTGRPGTIKWNTVPGIGTVGVNNYYLELYKTGTASAIEAKTVDSSRTEYDFSNTIRANGAGNYKVKITANSNNVTDVKNSDPAESQGIFATQVHAQFASDDISNVGGAGNTIGISKVGETPQDNYIAIAGDQDIVLRTTLKNATGYSVNGWMVTGSYGQIQNTVQTGDVVTAGFKLGAGLSSSAPIEITLGLDATPATLNVEVTSIKNEVSYGYESDEAPQFMANATTVSGDNIASDMYTYSYQWMIKKNASEDFTDIPGMTGQIGTLPVGYDAASNYLIKCEVTAVRNDNQMSIQKRNSTACGMKIKKAGYTAHVIQADWTYGENRTTPSVSKNPENKTVHYYYNTTNTGELDSWSNEIPTDIGHYYVKAVIDAGINYSAVTTEALEFEIKKNKLTTPTDLRMEPSTTAPYGLASWDAVAGPVENNGTALDSKSKIDVSYIVKLYHANNIASSDWEVQNQYETEDTTYDMTSDIGSTGAYKFSVTAIAKSDNGVDNCEDSQESAKRGDLDISAAIEAVDGVFDKKYDGTPLKLKVHTTLDEGTVVTYQWLCNNHPIDGATGATFEATYVEQSGIYECNVTVAGQTFHSTNHEMNIAPREITLTSEEKEKTYDGTELTAPTYSITSSVGLALEDKITNLTMDASITDTGHVTNEMNHIIIKSGDREVYNEDGSVSNYKVTKVEKELTIHPKDIGTGEEYADGILVSQPRNEVYNATAYTPEVSIKDSNILDGTTLVKDTDYDVTYQDNVHKGTAKVVLTAKGNFKGQIIRKFAILPKEITVKSEDQTKVYNGEEQKSTGVLALSLTDGTLLCGADHITEVEFLNGQKNVGTVTNMFKSLQIKNGDDEVVTQDYEISPVYGTIRVTEANDTLEITNDIGKIYDGTCVSRPDHTKNGSGEVSYKYYKESERAGEYTVLAGAPKDAGNYYVKAFEAKAGNYFAAESAYVPFTIAKREIKIIPNALSSVYKEDMKDLTYRQEGDIVPGEDLQISLHTDALRDSNIGDYPITVTYADDPNYNVEVESGKDYTILPAEMKIDAKELLTKYDGTAKEYSISVETPEHATVYYGSESLNKTNYSTLGSTTKKTYTNVGTYTVYYYVVAPNYKDKSGQQTVKIDKGIQTIIAHDKTVTYDGNTHSITATATGGSVSYTNNGQVGKGSYTVRVTANETDCYAAAYCDVKLTIEARDLWIKACDADKVYDGTPLQKQMYEIVSGSIAPTDSITGITINGSQTDAGESANRVENISILNADSDNVNSNYSIHLQEGNLKVEKATPVVTLLDVSALEDKTYSKTELGDPVFTNTGSGTANICYYKIKDGVETQILGHPMEAGDYAVRVQTQENRNYHAASSTTYRFHIAKRALHLTASNVESSYNENILNLPVSITGDGICLGDDLNIKAITTAQKGSNVGNYPIMVSYRENSNYDVDVTGALYVIHPADMPYDVANYSGSYDKKAHGISLQVPNGVEIYYSDTPLNASNYAVEGSMDELKYSDVGNYNVYYYLHSDNYIDKSGMQMIQIQKAYPIISVLKGQTMYDGSEHSILAVSNGGDLTYSDNEWVNVGEYPVMITSHETANYYEGQKKVTYEVTKRDITVTASSKVAVYTGSTLRDHSYEITGSGLADGDTVGKIVIKGEQTQVGSSSNLIEQLIIVNRAGENVTANYEIKLEDGTLKVLEQQKDEEKHSQEQLPVKQQEEINQNDSEESILNVLDREEKEKNEKDTLNPSQTKEKVEQESEEEEGLLEVTIPDEQVTGNKAYTYGEGKLIISAESARKKDVMVTLGSAKQIFMLALTTEEQKYIKDGGTMEVKLIVRMCPKNVPQDDRNKIEQGFDQLKEIEPDAVFGEYADVILKKQKAGNGSHWEKVEELSKPVDVTITSETLEFVDGAYYILHVHQGEFEMLKDKDDVKDAITIRTDKFSTYAFCYVPDVINEQQTEQENKKNDKDYGYWLFLFAAIMMTAELVKRNKDKY